MTQPYSPIEEVIAKGKLAIIQALENKYIALRDDTYSRVCDGKFFNSLANRYVTLTQCTTDTLERYYRSAINIFELAEPTNRTQAQAIEHFASLSPEARTIQLAYLFADRMEANERHADKVANG